VISKERLRELAAWRLDGHKVLSLYLNLDPSEFPTPRDRSVELQSLLDSAERGLRQDSLERTQREELKRDLERVRSYFGGEFDPKGTRGVAVFCAVGADLFDVIRLPNPITSEVVIDDSPFIEPLTRSWGSDGYCVLLVNRQVARILIGGTGGLREVASMVDDVHRWHDQGGWSQSRYQRGIVKETRDHLKHAGDEVFKRFKLGRVQRLIVGTPDEMRGEVEHHLHPYLRERIAGWIDVATQASPTEITNEARGVIERDEREREWQCLDRLKSELGRGGRGAAGLADTFSALNERRVETLLIQDGFRTEGWASPASDFLSTEPGRSPQGAELQKREDVIESAIESALGQSADVLIVRHHDELRPLGSIGAVLRF
jgi:peptide chain release factor subunit 1